MIGHGIEITTQIGCLNCDYCPQDKLLAAYKSDVKRMTFDTFLKCLVKIPPSVRIHFSGFSEPFLSGYVSLMIRSAYYSGHEIVVYSTLNGLTNDLCKSLKECPPKIFAIHVPDSHTHYHYSNFLSGVMALNENGIQYSFESVTDPITRAGNLSGTERPRIAGPINCRENRHLQSVLLPNGDVYLCCMDYALENKLGNLLEQSYESLFESDRYKHIVAGMKDDSIDILCRKCERACND